MNTMRHLLPTLIARDFSRRRSLLAFTLLAIVATSCLTVWFVASIDLNAFADDNGKQDFFGRYTLAIAGTRQLPYDVTDCIPDLPDVVRTSFARQTTATVYLKGFAEAEVPSGMGDRRSPMLLGMTDQTSPFPLAEGRWFEKPGECVVGTAAADIITADASRKATSRRLRLGDVLRVPTPVGDVELTVVGLVRQQARPSLTRQQGSATFGWGFGTPMATRAAQPQNSGKAAAGAPPAGQRPPRGLFGRGAQVTPTAPSIYLSMGDVTRCASQPGDANILFVELKDPTRVRDFYRQLEEAAGGPLDAFGVRAIDTLPPAPGDLAAFAEDGGEARVIRQAWPTVGLVILASVFIVFTTMSLAVSGRTRDLALLRTIGLTRRQVAAYILLEGLLLGVLGWAGGVLSGWLLLTLLLYWQAGVVPLVTLSPQSLLFALACSTLGALAASLIPAWRATRVSPAETLPVTALQRLPARRLRRWGILGLAAANAAPLLAGGRRAAGDALAPVAALRAGLLDARRPGGLAHPGLASHPRLAGGDAARDRPPAPARAASPPLGHSRAAVPGSHSRPHVPGAPAHSGASDAVLAGRHAAAGAGAAPACALVRRPHRASRHSAAGLASPSLTHISVAASHRAPEAHRRHRHRHEHRPRPLHRRQRLELLHAHHVPRPRRHPRRPRPLP